MNTIKGITNNSPHYTLSILYTEEPVHTKVFHLQTDNHITGRIALIKITSRLRGACYVMQLGLWSISSPLTLSNPFIPLTVSLQYVMEQSTGLIYLTV
jgi:hypothetical protein